MSRDSLIKWTIISATVLFAGGLIVALGLNFPAGDAVSPMMIAVLLGCGAAYYRRRGEERFVTCLNALLHVTLFTACYSVAMYAAGAIGRPFVDDSLVHLDARADVHLPAIVEWATGHPALQRGLEWAYNSLLWQTPLVIVVLGFSGARRSLERFVLQFMLGAWVCLIVFSLFPAAGPFAAYGYAPNATQARYLQHLHELREGVRTIVTWRGAEGLITFPSFHTVWAMLLAWAVRKNRSLIAPSLLLNAAVIAATLTTGWHYFTDVVGGCLVGAGVIWITEGWTSRRSAPQVVSESAASDRLPVLTDELADRLLPIPEFAAVAQQHQSPPMASVVPHSAQPPR